jgi:hypothetical protein
VLTLVSRVARRVWLTKLASVLLALCFPWVSAASGGMILCFKSTGQVGFGPGGGLVCAGAAVCAATAPHAAAPCAECLDDEGCADVPGKGLLSRPPPGVAQKRLSGGQSSPSAPAMGPADAGAPVPCAPGLPRNCDGQHGMRLYLAALSTVVLRR